MKMSTLDWVASALVIIGGLNWGLVGLFHFNLVEKIFGMNSALTMIIYVLVGLSAVWMVLMMMKNKNAM